MRVEQHLTLLCVSQQLTSPHDVSRWPACSLTLTGVGHRQHTQDKDANYSATQMKAQTVLPDRLCQFTTKVSAQANKAWQLLRLWKSEVRCHAAVALDC
jgi:hypothetical protein